MSGFFKAQVVAVDHFLVNSKILFPYVKSTEENKEKLEILEIKSTPRYNTESLEDDTILYLYRKRLDKKTN